MNLFDVFAEAFEPKEQFKIILCDGDCGDCYKEEDLHRSDDGYDMCRSCMFNHLAEEKCEQ
tara:strand:+ start:70 stop:252 length:183 start_codon:yes stop_codon:yes gene_type:complete